MFSTGVSLSTKKTAPYGRYHNVYGGRSTESGAVPIKKKKVPVKKQKFANQ